MAFIRISKVRGKEYVQVADYYYDSKNKRKLKILKSFGALSPESKMEAEVYLSQIKAMEKYKEENENKSSEELIELALKIGGGILGAFLGYKILKWIFSDNNKE